MQENSENFNDDDYYTYSSLSTFSFGAASAHRQSFDPDMPSPLSVQTTSESGHTCSTGSTDRTPRPSISHARGSDDECGEDENRRIRAKMRAIDDGGRRPSLPTNLYIPDRPSLDGPSSHRLPDASGSDSDPIAPSSASDPEFDLGNESGIVDTDVELEGIVPDDASQNTFGLDQVRSPYTSDSGAESDVDASPGTQQCADYYIVDPNERRHEAGSPVVFASAESDDEDSDVSETGSRGLATMRRNSIAIRMATARDRSLRAHETDLRRKETNTREREDSAATVRRPTDEDMEAGVNANITNSDGERQPSLPTPNWSMFSDNASPSMVEDSGENVYQGIDLNYIMSVGGSAGPGSRRSSHSFIAPQTLPLPPPKDKAKSKDKDKRKKDKSKGNEPLDVAAMQGLIGPSPALSNLLDVAPWADAGAIAGPRRPSTVTLDDSFAGGLRRLDPLYAEQRKEWSFIREREQVVLAPRVPDGTPRMWDVWRCAKVGKIRLERATLPPCTFPLLLSSRVHVNLCVVHRLPPIADPDKPSQQRLNAEHDVDPDCANDLGGPTTVVHRHSRALAFSIYRHYSLRNYRSNRGRPSMTASSRSHRPSEGRSTLVMPAHDGILLATKRVQEQFTYTKSTSRLDTHGLLPEDGDNRRDNRRGPQATHRQLPSRDLPPNPLHREPPSSRQIMDLSRLEGLDDQPSSLRRSQSTHTANSSLDYSGTTTFAFSGPTSQASSQSSVTTSSASSISERPLSPHNEAEEDSDGEFSNTVPHTSHAEAFGTLDSYAIDQMRNEQVPTATRRPNRLLRFLAPPSGSISRSLPPNLVSTNPPWLTLVTRSKQEEQDRAIQGLRSSFKDVGLVPSTRPKSGAGIGRKGKGKNKDVLTQVPDDSLYMLLPLWPHETDPASAARERRERPMRGLDREQNLYLLVYYVPFDKCGEGKPVKKRSRSRSRKGGDHERHHPTPLFDVRLGFRVVGRLIAHSDLNGSGIRLPVRGLSVTGSMAEAEMGIPPASLRDVHSDDFIIGLCLDRSGTIEFVPEGLEKLGLCVPRTEPLVQLHTHPAMQTADPIEDEVVSQPLTAIGRAAIEVAWLGCMALTTFYGPQSQDRA